jgi:hypothetical protein
MKLNLDDLVEKLKPVTPAKAVPPSAGWIPAPRFREDKLRGNDQRGEILIFYDFINLGFF